MKPVPLFLAVLFAALVPPAVCAQQQRSTCAAPDDDAMRLRATVRQLVVSRVPAEINLRSSVGLPAVDSTTIVPVTDDRTCARIADGINAAYKTPGRIRALHVVKVGTSYAAFDPAWPASDEWRPLIVVDKRYTYTGSIAAM